MQDISSLWKNLSTFNPNEAIVISSSEVFQNIFSKIPANSKLVCLLICDPFLCTCTQQGALFLFFNEIHKIWGNDPNPVVTLVTRKKTSGEEMQPTDLWEPGWKGNPTLVSPKEIFKKTFNSIFKGMPKELNVVEIAVTRSRNSTTPDPPLHDRFILILIQTAEGAGKELYKISLSHGIDVFANPSPPFHPGRNISSLLLPHSKVQLRRCEIFVQKFCKEGAKEYFDGIVDLTIQNENIKINKLHERLLTSKEKA